MIVGVVVMAGAGGENCVKVALINRKERYGQNAAYERRRRRKRGEEQIKMGKKKRDLNLQWKSNLSLV